MDRLLLLKALADDSRYAIFAELSRADQPLSTVDLALRLDLHPNTVRLHLERLRDVGLVDGSTAGHGSVGRPQHHWTVAAGAPALGLQPDGFRLLAHLLAEALATTSADPEALASVGRRSSESRQGESPPRIGRTRTRRAPAAACLAQVLGELADLGFDPVAEPAGEGGAQPVAFGSCPFREVATAYPDLVCTLHRGITEGIVATAAANIPGVEAAVTAFATLVDADPCRAELTLTATE